MSSVEHAPGLKSFRILKRSDTASQHNHTCVDRVGWVWFVTECFVSRLLTMRMHDVNAGLKDSRLKVSSVKTGPRTASARNHTRDGLPMKC